MSGVSEKEIVTLALGNYSTLVAAQWANSTSHYDMHHSTLYTSRYIHQVLGGSALSADSGEMGMGSSKRVRVPRLVLLDAPTGVRLESLQEMVEEEEERNKEEEEEHEEEEHPQGNALWDSSEFPPAQQRYDMELLGASNPAILSSSPSPQSLQKRVQTLHRMLQRAPWEWRKVASDVREEEESEEEEEGAAMEERYRAKAFTATHVDPAYRQLSEDTRTPYYHPRRDSHSTDNSETPKRARHDKGHSRSLYEEEEEKEECAGSSAHSEAGQQHRRGGMHKKKGAGRSQKDALRAATRRIFSSSFSDFPVPWWHYISTGLCSDAVITLRPPQHAEAARQVAASHSFGYGVAHLNDTGSIATMEMESLTQSLRRQVEDADVLQGLQCFVDADSMFGGAAYNTLESFWEEAGSKVPVTVVSIFQPLPALLSSPFSFSSGEMGGGLQVEGDGAGWVGPGFAAQRREEQALNRLLATTMLSRHSSAVYIPIELRSFEKFFASSSSSWLEDDRATAQLIAACVDTALYGARDGGSLHPPPGSSTSTGRGVDYGSTPVEPAFFLQEWTRTIRPVNSLRVAAMMGALPLILRHALPSGTLKELSEWLEDTPLLGPTSASVTRQLLAAPYEKVVRQPGAGQGIRGGAESPGSFLGQFSPLSHVMDYSPLEPQGRVLGHAVSLRGAGVLPSTVYPVREAMLRYALPLRTSTYLPFIARANLPVSESFPMSLLYSGVRKDGSGGPRATHSEGAEGNRPEKASPVMRREWLDGVDCGSHVLSTYASSNMLKGIFTEAERVLLPQYHSPYLSMHQSRYEMEIDDWHEVLEEGKQIFDDYNHAPPQDSDEEDF